MSRHPSGYATRTKNRGGFGLPERFPPRFTREMENVKTGNERGAVRVILGPTIPMNH